MRIAWSMNAICRPSGDQEAPYRKPGPSRVTVRSSPDPSALRSVSSYSPVRSLQYATWRPSGDHDGERSAVPDVCVSVRGVPCSAGSVNTSPRASTTARMPVGEIPTLCTSRVTGWARGFTDARSVTTRTSTGRGSPPASGSR